MVCPLHIVVEYCFLFRRQLRKPIKRFYRHLLRFCGFQIFCIPVLILVRNIVRAVIEIKCRIDAGIVKFNVGYGFMAAEFLRDLLRICFRKFFVACKLVEIDYPNPLGRVLRAFLDDLRGERSNTLFMLLPCFLRALQVCTIVLVIRYMDIPVVAADFFDLVSGSQNVFYFFAMLTDIAFAFSVCSEKESIVPVIRPFCAFPDYVICDPFVSFFVIIFRK